MKYAATTGIKVNRKLITIIAAVIICLLFLFFRVYEFKVRSEISFDQVNNAWAAYRIIAEHKFPLEGPAAKMSSITIGPLYYYYVAFFYWITDLRLIASPVIALVTAIINFGILYSSPEGCSDQKRH